MLVLGISLGSGTSGNKHFRFLVVPDVSCLVFLRLLDCLVFVTFLFTDFVLVDLDKRIRFPSDTFAIFVIKLIISKLTINMNVLTHAKSIIIFYY